MLKPSSSTASSSSSSNAAVDAGRRDFLKANAVAGLAAGLTASLSSAVYAAGSDTIKVGLVGCGGRGTGAAREALGADPNTLLVAVGDPFAEQIEGSLSNLKAQVDIADRVVVDNDHKFVGLHAYQDVIKACDVVLLASPPGFRPLHFRAAVEAGKHIFSEKPVATDAPGCRHVMESIAMAKEKGLGILAGFCWRYDYAKRALFEKVHEGAIGELQAAYGTYLTGPVKPMPPAATRPDGMSDLEWQVRNWYNFTWLAGDGLVEQAIHTVDWLAWAFGDQMPARCTAVGGRQIPANGGNIFDHIEVNYEWESGVRAFLAQRQIPGCHNENNLYLMGTKGMAVMNGRGVSTKGETNWKYTGPSNNMYQTEHDEFFASLRAGKPISDGDRLVKSTLMGIMGRMAGYTGQQITWEMVETSQEVLVPEIDDWNTPAPTQGMPMPGLTQYV